MTGSICPNCRQPMMILEWDAIEVDQCLSCGGIWLDAGELEEIVRAAKNEPGRLTDAVTSALPVDSAHRRRCPRCRRFLSARRLRESGVIIDLCPRYDGIWFDRGELQALLRQGSSNGPVARFLGNLFEHELSAGAEGGMT